LFLTLISLHSPEASSSFFCLLSHLSSHPIPSFSHLRLSLHLPLISIFPSCEANPQRKVDCLAVSKEKCNSSSLFVLSSRCLSFLFLRWGFPGSFSWWVGFVLRGISYKEKWRIECWFVSVIHVLRRLWTWWDDRKTERNLCEDKCVKERGERWFFFFIKISYWVVL
jgi:hypothetical protein